MCFFVPQVLKIFKQVEKVETIKVNANYISIYDTFIDAQPRVSERTHTVNFVDNFHDMQMSAGAVKTVKKAVNIILYLARKRHFAEIRAKSGVSCTSFRNNEVRKKAFESAKNSHLCTFVTLTLPAKQMHTDKEITKHCINPFLSYARKYFNVRYFIWKKELQGNGNLHFHFVTDRYIDHEYLRRAWNRIINAGVVEGVEHPFNYVDRYRAKMLDLYKDGFNRDTILDNIKQQWYIKENIENTVTKFETKAAREITAAEYDEIANTIYNKELAKWHKSYTTEMKKPEPERFTNPNSTDIDAVKSPAGVSLYVAKYIAKDISDNPALVEYTATTQQMKETIYSLLRDIDTKTANNEPTDKEREQLEYFKNALQDYRKEHCPILGHLWFKSKSLTPFVTGLDTVVDTPKGKVKKKIGLIDFINADIGADLTKLFAELTAKSTATKQLIIRSYEKDEKGNNTDKVLCTTLLTNVFDFVYKKDNKGRFIYPTLRRMWIQYVTDCIKYNRERGLYEF